MQPATTTAAVTPQPAPQALEQAQSIWDSLALAGDRVRELKGAEFADVLGNAMAKAANERAAKYGVDVEALQARLEGQGATQAANVNAPPSR